MMMETMSLMLAMIMMMTSVDNKCDNDPSVEYDDDVSCVHCDDSSEKQW